MTEWRTLEWLPDYEISECGDVRKRNGRALAQSRQSAGYQQVSVVRRDGRRLPQRVHRLVCEAWHGPPPFDSAQAAHWDGDRLNNHFANLRWATGEENMRDRRRHGTNGHKLDDTMVAAIRERASVLTARGSRRQIAREFDVSEATISKIVNGHAWREAA